MSRNIIVAFFFGVAIGVATMTLRTPGPVHAAQGPANSYGISANNSGAWVVDPNGRVSFCAPPPIPNGATTTCAGVR